MNKVVSDLMEKADIKYKRFNENMIKGNSPIIGVRIPELRRLANKIKRHNLQEFINEYEGIYFEEKIIKAVILASDEKLFNDFAWEFIQTIDSWCLCDTFCITCKFMSNNLDKYYPLILKMLDSDKEFVIRTGFVLLLHYYVNDSYVDESINLTKRKYTFYYAKISIAWLLSEIYVFYPEKIREYFINEEIDEFIRNKTIEKVTDSLRVSNLDKMRLRRANNSKN